MTTHLDLIRKDSIAARQSKAEVKRQIKTGELPLDEAIETVSHPNLTIEDLLTSARFLTPRRIEPMLDELLIWPGRPTSDLTERQRGELAEAVRERFGGWCG